MKRQIVFLRGLAILAVVGHHATAWGFVAMFWWTHRYASTSVPDYTAMGSPSYWLLTGLNQVALFSVPAFLLISGFSAVYGLGNGTLRADWRVVRPRLRALIGPYVLWSLIVYGIDAVLGQTLTPAEYAVRLLTGEVVDGYYFVPMLVQFYLLSPFLVRAARSRPRLLLGIAIAIQALTTVAPYVAGAGRRAHLLLDLPAWSALRWPLYYVLGTVVASRPRPVLGALNRYRAPLLACAATLAVLTVAEADILWRWTADWDWAHGGFRLSSTAYALTFLLLALTWRVAPSPTTHAVERAGALSYGIYLMHPKALELGARAIYHLAPGLLADQVAFAAVLFAVPLAGCWLAMALVARSPARRVYHVVFG